VIPKYLDYSWNRTEVHDRTGVKLTLELPEHGGLMSVEERKEIDTLVLNCQQNVVNIIARYNEVM